MCVGYRRIFNIHKIPKTTTHGDNEIVWRKNTLTCCLLSAGARSLLQVFREKLEQHGRMGSKQMGLLRTGILCVNKARARSLVDKAMEFFRRMGGARSDRRSWHEVYRSAWKCWLKLTDWNDATATTQQRPPMRVSIACGVAVHSDRLIVLETNFRARSNDSKFIYQSNRYFKVKLCV